MEIFSVQGFHFARLRSHQGAFNRSMDAELFRMECPNLLILPIAIDGQPWRWNPVDQNTESHGEFRAVSVSIDSFLIALLQLPDIIIPVNKWVALFPGCHAKVFMTGWIQPQKLHLAFDDRWITPAGAIAVVESLDNEYDAICQPVTNYLPGCPVKKTDLLRVRLLYDNSYLPYWNVEYRDRSAEHADQIYLQEQIKFWDDDDNE